MLPAGAITEAAIMRLSELLQPGDIITRINRKPVTSLAAIVTAQADFVAHPDAALIEAQRDRETMLRILKP